MAQGEKKPGLMTGLEIHQRRRMEETTLITLREESVGISVIRIIEYSDLPFNNSRPAIARKSPHVENRQRLPSREQSQSRLVEGSRAASLAMFAALE
jgi:hypothetical protein